MNKDDVDHIWLYVTNHAQTITVMAEHIIHFTWIIAVGIISTIVFATFGYIKLTVTLSDLKEFKEKFNSMEEKVNQMTTEVKELKELISLLIGKSIPQNINISGK